MPLSSYRWYSTFPIALTKITYSTEHWNKSMKAVFKNLSEFLREYPHSPLMHPCNTNDFSQSRCVSRLSERAMRLGVGNTLSQSSVSTLFLSTFHLPLPFAKHISSLQSLLSAQTLEMSKPQGVGYLSGKIKTSPLVAHKTQAELTQKECLSTWAKQHREHIQIRCG